MKQVESIKENYEFKRVYKRGKSNADYILAVYIFKNYKKQNRLGITVSNKVGKAVIRNKIRRRIKSAFHEIQKDLKPSIDIVVVARTKSAQSDFSQIEKSLTKNLKKLGAFKDE